MVGVSKCIGVAGKNFFQGKTIVPKLRWGKMKKFLLIGIGGVYNYGTEAIVRGTEKILHSRWPDAKIFYASFRPEDDRRRLVGCDVEVIPRQKLGRYSPRNITRKLLSYCGVQYRPCFDPPKQADGMDAVFSIGGDIFTLNKNNNFNASLAKFGNAVLAKNIPYILWGGSVGPFTANPSAEKFFKNHLSKVTLITAREKETVNYLASLGITSNVILAPDPAFFVGNEIVKEGKAKTDEPLTIGINLSPLSVRHLNLDLDDVLLQQAQAIEGIIKKFDANIFLIPHVWCDFNEGDDDFRYLKKLKQKISNCFHEKINLIDNDPGFIGLKKVLIQCDLVIASRMHCAINATSCHVPTIFLSYSKKSQGMCEYVYGNQKWVLPLIEFRLDQINLWIDEMSLCKPEINKNLSSRIFEIQNNKNEFVKKLKISFSK
jgi:polysaccharide pyruvyl transferase WcaK-like protein